jgi:hypothetical protein
MSIILLTTHHDLPGGGGGAIKTDCKYDSSGFLTFSYSSEGSPALAVLRPHYL